MNFAQTPLAGVIHITPTRIGDARGHFARTFCTQAFADQGLAQTWAQMNMSHTATKGAMRGLHFQRGPAAEDKLIRCTQGAGFDVAVDLRTDSPTFGQWTAITLTPEDGNAIYIPKGCAHGFQTLRPDTVLHYCHSTAYTPDAEGGVDATDPAIGIDWPLPIALRSDRDTALPQLKDAILP